MRPSEYLSRTTNWTSGRVPFWPAGMLGPRDHEDHSFFPHHGQKDLVSKSAPLQSCILAVTSVQ